MVKKVIKVLIVCLFLTSLYFNWRFATNIHNFDFGYSVPRWNEKERQILMNGYKVLAENDYYMFDMYPCDISETDTEIIIRFQVLDFLQLTTFSKYRIMDGTTSFYFDKNMKLIRVQGSG